MNKPFWQSKKFWVAVVTACAAIVAYFVSPELAKLVAFVGSTLVAGFGLADMGKEGKAIEGAAAVAVAAMKTAPAEYVHDVPNAEVEAP